MRWYSRIFRRGARDREIDRELRFHIEQDVQRLIAEGVTPAEARRQALAAFGGFGPIHAASREVWQVRWLRELGRDVQFAFRMMQRRPGFACAAVLSLSVGIGVNAAIYNIVDALLLRRLPIEKPTEMFYAVRTGRGKPTPKFSYPAFVRYQTGLASSHTRLAAMNWSGKMQLTTRGSHAELVVSQLVSGDWFDVLGVRPELGRVLTVADDDIQMEPVAVISDGYWTRRFGRDPTVIGTTVSINGLPTAVIGVAAEGFSGVIVGEPTDLWMPLSMQVPVHLSSNADISNGDGDKPWAAQEGVSWLMLLARVQPPQTPAGAHAILDTMFYRDVQAKAAGIRNRRYRENALREHAELLSGARGLSDLREQFGQPVVVLMITASLVLFVACANLANLLMAQGLSRSREFAIRASIGASRARLTRQLLAESLLLSMVAGTAGLLASRGGTRVLLGVAVSDPTTLRLETPMTWSLIGFTFLVSMLTGILFASLPALRFSRANAQDVIKSGGRVLDNGGRLSRGLPLTRLLLMGQMALSLVLLIGGLLFVRTMHNLLSVDPGFQPTHVITARFDSHLAGYAATDLPALRERLVAEALALPGVQSAGIASCGTMANCEWRTNIAVPGRSEGINGEDEIQEDWVDAGYFSTLAMPLVAGRSFLPTDTRDSALVTIVNETMARHFFDGGTVVGHHFETDGKTFEVVGVVRDSHVNGLREASPRMVFFPLAQHPEISLRNLYVRTTGNSSQAEHLLRTTIAKTDRGIAIREIVTLQDLADRSVAQDRLVSGLTGAFGFLAVAVASFGLYGMLSYAVARRTNEFGVRLALGASAWDLRRLVFGETTMVLGAGAAIGLAIAFSTLTLVGSLLYGVTARDPVTFAVATATLTAVGLLASALPAWRASRVDPMQALRAD